MIVAPTPTAPPSPARRRLGTGAVFLPAVLLAAIVGAGLLGPHPGEARPRVPAGSPAGAAPATQLRPSSPSPAATTGPAVGPAIVEIRAPDAFPGSIASLEVRSVTAILAAHPAVGGPEIVAVSGYLLAWPDGASCSRPTASLGSAGCDRSAILSEQSWATTGGGGFSGLPPHLHALVPAGVPLPPGVLLPAGDLTDLQVPTGDVFPRPVVVIARFGASSAGCREDLEGCLDPFTIDRVAWADGRSLAFDRFVEPGLAAGPNDPMVVRTRMTASVALGPTTLLLQVMLLRPATLAAVNAQAAATVSGGRAYPVWYVRGLGPADEPPFDPSPGRRAPQILWATIEPVTGALIATGVEADPGHLARGQSTL